MTLPLAGLRVIDMTRVLAGPFCTLLLADLGADVVKIERPKVGDDARQFGPFLPSGESAYFASLNRGKRSVALDLSRPEGVQALSRLVARADVLVENFRPGTLAGLGLPEERLRELHPKLVYAAVTGFGRTSAHRRRPAYDIIIQALSGLMSVTGHEVGKPARVGTSISDILAGLFAAVGILAALVERGRLPDREGRSLDLAMLDCSVAALENALARAWLSGEAPVPLGTRHPSITPFQAFRCLDASIVIAAGNEALWRALCEQLCRSDLLADARFETNAKRTEHQAALAAELERTLATRGAAEWLARFEGAGIPAAPIRSVDMLLTDTDLISRGMLHTVRTAAGETLVTAGSPLRFDGTALPLSDRVPALGQHTAEVFAEWLGEETPARDE